MVYLKLRSVYFFCLEESQHYPQPNYIDDENIFDRYEVEKRLLGPEADKIHENTKKLVEAAWQKQLEIQ